MLTAAFLWRGINLLSALCLILVTTPAYADEHQHKHQSQSNAEPSMHVLKPGEKWKTDEVVKLFLPDKMTLLKDALALMTIIE